MGRCKTPETAEETRMVGEILYFLHRHVRVATPVAFVLLMAVFVSGLNLVAHLWSAFFG